LLCEGEELVDGNSSSHATNGVAPTIFKALDANLRESQLHLGVNIEIPRDAARIRVFEPPLVGGPPWKADALAAKSGID
jgi:hypothetical protein